MATSNNIEISYSADFSELMFGKRLSYIIESQGVSKAWVANKLGISKQALNYLLKHGIKPKFVDELAELLKLNAEWLETGAGNPTTHVHSPQESQIKKIPVITKSTLSNNKNTHQSQKSIDFSCNQSENYIAYRLDNNSNFPPFIQGSILIFDTHKQPTNGDYVLSKIQDNLFVRQYLVDDNNICYKASNHEYKTFINPTAEIMGVLFEARYQIN